MTSRPAPGFDLRAAEAAHWLRGLANPRRMRLLCHLVAEGEATVGALARRVGLSPAALSQHLARLRAEGVLTCRREGTRAYYRVADPRVERLVATLHGLFREAPRGPSAFH